LDVGLRSPPQYFVEKLLKWKTRLRALMPEEEKKKSKKKMKKKRSETVTI
jgi:hypothetical protein